MAAPTPAKPGVPKNKWVLVGGALAGVVVLYLIIRSRSAGSAGQQAVAQPGTDSSGMSGTAGSQVGGAPAATSVDYGPLLAGLIGDEANLVGGAQNTFAEIIGSQDQLIGELGTGAQTLAMTSEMQLGAIAGSAVNGLVTLATNTQSAGSPQGGSPQMTASGAEPNSPSQPSSPSSLTGSIGRTFQQGGVTVQQIQPNQPGGGGRVVL